MYILDTLLNLRTWAQSGGTREERFDFGVWAQQSSCGTVMCLAGKVSHDAGARFLWRDGNTTHAMDKDGRKVSIQAFAADQIGVTSMESVVLFSPDSGDGELNKNCALAFLDVLIERARASEDNMSDREALDWMKDWFEENLEEGR